MMPLSKTKKRFFISFFLVALALGGYALVFSLLSKKAGHVSELAAQTNSITDRKTVVENAQVLLRETEVERSVLSASFVEEDDPVSFISEVENLGAVSNTLLEIESVESETTENIEQLHTSLSAIGAWTDVHHLLSLVEALPYNVTITSFAVERHSEEEGSSAWKTNIGFTVPVISQP